MQAGILVIAIWTMILAGAALLDLRSFRIPNLFPILLITLFASVHGLAGYSSLLWANVLHFLLALFVGMLMFARRWIGGGDAKLYAAVALWFNWSGAATLVFMTTISGLLLAIGFVVARMGGIGRKRLEGEPPPKRSERRIPYGLAIATGALLSAAWAGWSKIFPAISL
jgi:prepilin peptidase CpaA